MNCCAICLDGEITHAFIPCGHLVCCNQCYADLNASGRSRCPVCRQDVDGTLRVYVVSEEERQRIADRRIGELKLLSSTLTQKHQEVEQKKQEVEQKKQEVEREHELVLADRERKKVLLHMDPTDRLKAPTKARAKAMKHNETYVRGLPDLISNLLTTVDQTGGYYRKCEESELQPGDQAVVIGYPRTGCPAVAQGVVTIRHTPTRPYISVGTVCYSFWNFHDPPIIFKYGH